MCSKSPFALMGSRFFSFPGELPLLFLVFFFCGLLLLLLVFFCGLLVFFLVFFLVLFLVFFLVLFVWFARTFVGCQTLLNASVIVSVLKICALNHRGLLGKGT